MWGLQESFDIAAETVESVTSRTGMSLEDSLLEMTTASAEFASA